MPQAVAHRIDGIAAGAVVLSFLDYAPKVAALFAILWYAIQGYEYFKKKWEARKSRTRRATDK